jgi:hypothetical protein
VGWSLWHTSGFDTFGDSMLEAMDIIFANIKNTFGLAVIENAYDETAVIEAIPKDAIVQKEAELLKIAGENMPRILLKEIDILIIEEIGKNFSGTGVDPHVIGKGYNINEFPLPAPKIERMVLLDISEKSHGNAFGIGNFDVVTRKAVDKINYEATYTNCIAAQSPYDARIPIIADDEETAIRIAAKFLPFGTDVNNLKIAKIKNTLELSHIWVSDALLEYVKSNELLTIQV